MATKTMRLDEDTVEAAEIAAIKLSSQKLKRVLPREVVHDAVFEYLRKKTEEQNDLDLGL